MSSLLQRARGLRKNSTDVDRLLWKHLRAKRVAPSKFKRQEPIGSYIVDSVSYESRLIIELDGGQHACDDKRTAWLESQGSVVRRFWNNDVTVNLEGVVQRILDCLGALTLSPGPSPVKGEGRVI
jgi:very-short-patch-repair endonuclease